MRSDLPERLEDMNAVTAPTLAERVSRLWKEGLESASRATNLDERRSLAQAAFKRMAREVFMTQPSATELDFERCWPAIRDKFFIDYTMDLAASLMDSGALERD